MLDNEFLEYLEYAICKAYTQAGNKETKLWCKSVTFSQSEHYYSQEFIRDNRQVILKALVGKFGSTEYDLHLKFGEAASTFFSKKLDIKRCVPNPKKQELFSIDFEQNQIHIELS